MQDTNMLTTPSGQSLRFIRINIRETYLGTMMGTKAQATQFMLGDAKHCFSPENWLKYPFAIVGVSADLSELPPVTCTAMVFAENYDGKGNDAVRVVTWFQNEKFATPPNDVVKQIEELDWGNPSTQESDLVS